MRITERYDQIVRDTIRRVATGEEQVDHEVMLNPVEIGGPRLTIVLTMAGIQAGHRMGDIIVYHTPNPAPEDVDMAVQHCLHTLRKTKLELVEKLCENALETH